MSQRARLLGALVIGALGLRPLLIGVGPLLPRIEADFGFSHAEVGLLATIPLLGMGLFALAAPTIVGRFGSRRTVAACLALLCLCGLLRAVSPSVAVLLALTIPVGLGIGVAGAALPVFVKERFPLDSAFATGVYTTAIQVGSTISALIAVPLAVSFGGWRGATAIQSLAVVLALGAWLLLTSGGAPAAAATTSRARLAWRSPMAWWLALIFWLTALPFYGLMAWLAAAYIEHGWTEVAAGTLVGVVGFAGLPATLIVAWLADRVGSRRLYLLGSAVVYIVSGVGLILAPALGLVWAVLAGGSLGAMFTLAMTLPLDVSHDPARASGVVGMMLFVGYLLTALTPVALGAIRDATGSFNASLWVTVLAGVVLIAACLPLTPARLQRARGPVAPEVHARPGPAGMATD